MTVIRLNSNAHEEFIEVTREVNAALSELALDAVRARPRELSSPTAPDQASQGELGRISGLAHLFCRHTTAGLTVNENADPDVRRDILLALARIVPEDLPYRHSEGNSTAHLKASLMGCALTLPVRDGCLALGRWQGVYFCEFDGPRSGREVEVSFLPLQ